MIVTPAMVLWRKPRDRQPERVLDLGWPRKMKGAFDHVSFVFDSPVPSFTLLEQQKLLRNRMHKKDEPWIGIAELEQNDAQTFVTIWHQNLQQIKQKFKSR